MLLPLPGVFAFTWPAHIRGPNPSLDATPSRKPFVTLCPQTRYGPPDICSSGTLFLLCTSCAIFMQLSEWHDCLPALDICHACVQSGILNARPTSEGLAPGCRPLPGRRQNWLSQVPCSRWAGSGPKQCHQRPVRLKSGREQREEASARCNCVLGKRGIEGAWLSRTAMCCPVPSVTGVRSCEEWDLRQTPPGVGRALLLAASWRRESPGKLWNAPCSCTARRPQRGALIHTSSLT